MSSKIRVGAVAGGKSGDGEYIHIRVDGRIYRAHRLAWFYVTGEWPEGLVDHDDGNGLNNSWNNLRNATPLQNSYNRGKTKANTSGYKGVFICPHSGNWYAKIVHNGKQKRLGTYKTREEAYEVYCLWADMLHGEFANHGANLDGR
jgi:hypothetical protein